MYFGTKISVYHSITTPYNTILRFLIDLLYFVKRHLLQALYMYAASIGPR